MLKEKKFTYEYNGGINKYRNHVCVKKALNKFLL